MDGPIGRQLWLVYKQVGSKVFSELLKNPIAFSWVSNQIDKDRKEHIDLITHIFDALKPWLNLDLYKDIQKKEKAAENKIQKIAKTDAQNVEVTNLYNVMMKNAGLNIPNDEIKHG